MQPVKAIPDKLYFKIGEVCEITGVQPHVLRYWETEFPQLAPEKNRAGQRVYKRRDIELILKIKKLLYEDKFTIAGARKRLAAESRFKLLSSEAPSDMPESASEGPTPPVSPRVSQVLREVKRGLEELLAMLNPSDIITPSK
ncbi:HTH-type transcriptional repressor BluR [bacterium HR08]|nr:HTH-type transcriptional repressor BluR [bacterium HR08]